MLTEQEKRGFRQLLALVDTVDVVSLAKTATKNLIGISNNKGMDLIIIVLYWCILYRCVLCIPTL